ncbi:uncharacterized protein DUF2460 [Roseiarcus fermentans]|uniref:Uncharacterized protein DUF2460 n=1 Tax=Roseiarcus fermentans TaxID=1473586 RepID=A0A366EQ31_9HYPH|nr:glycoside hydrolase TIM-barrel-like domain-containing protein [Roseiarcus fermentans]RBP03800.1 uncharacterized protein DUF2460 [Roseiarcus fermentans]
MGAPQALGVHLLPSTGEWAYDTVATSAAQWDLFTGTIETAKPTNTYAGGGSTTDYTLALNQLQAQHPETTTVSVVVSWFFDSTDASKCRIYPSTIYLLGGVWQGGVATHWYCSGLTEATFPGVIPLPMTGADSSAMLKYFAGLLPDPSAALGSYIYGGTPSDPSIVRCIQDLKARGFKVVFYPFLLATCAGYPWRGRITYSPDLSSAAAAAVNAFLGPATTGMFSRDAVNLTVGYSGGATTDWTYRRMILHYANLCVIAGGVNLFVIGSELRGLETIRGPAWTKAGTLDGGGKAVWDYPFVAGLVTLANDVRSVFDGAGLTKNLSTHKNLITYSADWSDWMGYQHPGQNGQWPHLDSLWSSSNIDVVSFDNYLPLSDWTTGSGGLDVLNWSAPAPTGPWPPGSSTMSGLGLSGLPTIYSLPYLEANIEGGQYFNWFYNDGNNLGRGLDPNNSGQIVSLPEGDRLTQSRNAYSSGQQILAPKQLRWWWNNTHQAVYDTGSGWVPQGAQTEWVAQSKSIITLEYGCSNADKATNQPNVFFDPKSTESYTAFWSAWAQYGSNWAPVRDDTIAALYIQAVYNYWLSGSNNQTSGGGVQMLLPTFCCLWNWDARPFPIYPLDGSAWGDTGNWSAGDWFTGLRTPLPPLAPSADPTPPAYATFPTIATLGWSVHVRPRFATDVASHVSGREVRNPRFVAPLYDFELTFEVLRSDAAHQELQALAGFFEAMGGAATPFWFSPPNLSGGPYLCRFADDVQDFEEFMTMLFKLGTCKLQGVRG